MSTESDSSGEEIILITGYLKRKKRSRRAQWTRQTFLKRESLEEFHQLVPSLSDDEEKFKNYYRMSSNAYKELVEKVRPLVDIGHSNFRKSISLEERLTVTLRFLATGDSYMSASYRFRMAHNTISGLIPEICDAIYSSLQPEFLGCPKKEDWATIAQTFAVKKQFPNCVGALDGKHVRIQKPDNSGLQYFNYKMYTPIILMALVSAYLRFIVIDVGSYGRNSDGGVFANLAFGKKIINKQIDFPDDKPLFDGGQPMPHVLVADEAFRLLPNLMKPYPRRGLTDDKRQFNFRLSHARSTIECAFGVLASKFRIFHSPISVKPVNVDKIIKAACVLHDMILDRDGELCDELLPASEAFANLTNDTPVHSNKEMNVNASSRHSREIRDNFKEYFNRLYYAER